MNKENKRGTEVPLPFTGVHTILNSPSPYVEEYQKSFWEDVAKGRHLSTNLNHIYEDEGWGVFTVYRGGGTILEVQRLDDLSVLVDDDAAIPLAKRRGYKVGSLRSDYEVTNIDEVEGRVDHMSNKSYSLTLTDLDELVNHVIKKKFWSVTEVAEGLSTIELIKKYLNK